MQARTEKSLMAQSEHIGDGLKQRKYRHGPGYAGNRSEGTKVSSIYFDIFDLNLSNPTISTLEKEM